MRDDDRQRSDATNQRDTPQVCNDLERPRANHDIFCLYTEHRAIHSQRVIHSQIPQHETQPPTPRTLKDQVPKTTETPPSDQRYQHHNAQTTKHEPNTQQDPRHGDARQGTHVATEVGLHHTTPQPSNLHNHFRATPKLSTFPTNSTDTGKCATVRSM